MARKLREQRDARIDAISHAARGIQLLASELNQPENQAATSNRTREAELNFQEGRRMLAQALGRKWED